MFKDELKKLRLQKGWTQEKLAEIMNVGKSTISMYENGNRTPDFETLEEIADIFNVDLNRFSTANSTHQMASTGIMIPVLGYVRAGIPIEAVEDILGYEEISRDMARQGEYFALSIKGDSMEPKISEGDVVIVRRQETVENGEYAVVLVNGNDATVKKFYKLETGIKLLSTNPSYDPFFYTIDEVISLPVKVVGKVVELRAKF